MRLARYNIQDLFYKDNTTVGGFLSSIGFSPADVTAYGALIGPASLGLFGNPNINFGGGVSTLGDDSRSSDRDLTQHLRPLAIRPAAKGRMH